MPESKMDDCEILIKDDLTVWAVEDDKSHVPLTKQDAPEPLRGIKVLEPFMVAHEGARYFPGEIATVPFSVAQHWLKNRWVEELSQ